MSQQISKELDPIIKYLEKNSLLRCALIYGSFSKNTQSQDSDIDIAVAASSRMTTEQSSQIAQDLLGLTNRNIDLVDLHKVHPPLSNEIFKNPIWIKRDRDVLFRILRRTIYEAEDFLPLKIAMQKKRLKRLIE
jgi:predicted nucleotidyltransferase